MGLMDWLMILWVLLAISSFIIIFLDKHKQNKGEKENDKTM